MCMPSVSPEAFLYLVKACESGVESSDSVVRSHACSSIYNICTFVVKETEKMERGNQNSSSSNNSEAMLARRRRSSVASQSSMGGNHWLINYLQQTPATLPSLFSTVFNLVLFDDSSDQWSLSRPLYALILLQRDVSFYGHR
jgi:exportin-7